MKDRRLIGVIGSGQDDPELNKIAEEVGRLIASEGFVLVNGGLGGVMEASARGAKGAGGTTLGILPGLAPGSANRYIDIPVATGLGEGRNLLIVRAASALIAIGGGYGTLSEIALALKAGRFVAGLKTWDVSTEVALAESAADALDKVRKALGDSRPE